LLLVLAVDLPRMKPDFLNALLHHCETEIGAVPERAGMLEPLAAVYPKRSHALAVEVLKTDRPAARDFAEACSVRRMVRKVPVAACDVSCFDNWNQPADVAGGRRPEVRGQRSEPGGWRGKSDLCD